MQFRDLKAGMSLYVYDRCSIELNVHSVINVSAPHVDKQGGIANMVVDVDLESQKFTFKDTSEIGYCGNLIISADKSLILKEAEAQKANNEAMIARIDNFKTELPKLESIIDSLNPAIKEKKAQEERLNRLEDSISGLKEMVEILIKKKNGSN